MITNNNNNNRKMTTQLFTIPSFMVTLGKVAVDNVKRQQQVLKQRKQHDLDKKKVLAILIREINAAEKEGKKKAKIIAIEAKVAVKKIIANTKKQDKLQHKAAQLKAKKEQKAVKSEITKLNRTIYRQKNAISTLKAKM